MAGMSTRRLRAPEDLGRWQVALLADLQHRGHGRRCSERPKGAGGVRIGAAIRGRQLARSGQAVDVAMGAEERLS
jgi:hypothetical protein